MNLGGVYATGRSNVFAVPTIECVAVPGVYKTAPYSCLVVVPGPLADDQCIVNPGANPSAMPMVTPELRFLPWGPGH